VGGVVWLWGGRARPLWWWRWWSRSACGTWHSRGSGPTPCMYLPCVCDKIWDLPWESLTGRLIPCCVSGMWCQQSRACKKKRNPECIRPSKHGKPPGSQVHLGPFPFLVSTNASKNPFPCPQFLLVSAEWSVFARSPAEATIRAVLPNHKLPAAGGQTPTDRLQLRETSNFGVSQLAGGIHAAFPPTVTLLKKVHLCVGARISTRKSRSQAPQFSMKYQQGAGTRAE
jgi:hypothetical protein